MSTTQKVVAFLSAAILGALTGAFSISANALFVYLTNQDSSPLSAKLATALAVHMLATFVMFIIACLIGSTVYLLLRRFGFANYLTVGIVGLAVGLLIAPGFTMAIGGLITACVFHWRFFKATNNDEHTKD